MRFLIYISDGVMTPTRMTMTMTTMMMMIQVKHNTLSPDWGEAFVWDLSGCKPTELGLELYDWCARACACAAHARATQTRALREYKHTSGKVGPDRTCPNVLTSCAQSFRVCVYNFVGWRTRE